MANMTWSELCLAITDTIDCICDNPGAWIDKNETGVRKFAESPGPTAFLAALQECRLRGGKLDHFITDFGTWKVRAENAAPLQRQESDAEYYARQGLTGSMAKPLQKLELTPDEEAENLRLLAELKRKCPPVVPS
jgi:hypothetical protein